MSEITGGRTILSKRRFSRFQDTAFLNNQTYIYYFNLMQEIYLNLIHYENLPESLETRFIELTLFYRPGIAFFQEDILGELISLPFNPASEFNIYGNPRRVNVYSQYTGYNETLDNNYVIMYCNYTRIPPVEAIQLFAWRLYDIERTTDVNLRNQKTPKIIPISEGQRLTWKNVEMQAEGNYPTIPIRKDGGLDEAINAVIDMTVPYITDKLDIHKHNIFNEFLTFCGIENGNRDKKQSMTNDEVNGNWGNVEICRNTRLDSRKEAIKKVNKMFGTEIEVAFNSQLPSLFNKLFENRMEEWDGSIHNDTI